MGRHLETILEISTYLAQNPKYVDVRRRFDAEVAKRKETATTPSKDATTRAKTAEKTLRQTTARKRKRVAVEPASQLDAWKYFGEKEHIQVGRQHQVHALPRAGTNEPGEADNYVQDKLWELASFTPPLTRSIWYEWAKEASFASRFHQLIISSKKQMRIIASKIEKPVAFCLWYYYTKYKPSENYSLLKKMMTEIKKLQNLDECAICELGGDLLCCETCTNSYHLACLDLNPADVESIDTWSCPVCVKKRILLLSPTKAPRKLQIEDSSDSKSYAPSEASDLLYV